MKTKPTIAIIGATGSMGSAISKSLASGNYPLLLCANDQDKLQGLLQDIKSANASAKAEAINCSKEASWEADIIILAVPYQAEKEIVQKIREVAAQKIVISITNSLTHTFDGLLTSPDTSAAEELQKLLPHLIVVKAFNTTFAADFAQPVIDGNR